MGLWKSIKAIWEGWEKIDENDLPRWVKRAYEKWYGELPIRPYNKTKNFVGNNFIYRVRYGIGPNQGECPVIGWYKKSRNLEYPEGIPKNKKNLKRWKKGNQVIYAPNDFRNPFEP